ncbi:MAG: ABC transporter permease [Pyrobaculum sp.]|uniref:Binding-protein-dependent transport systems inner membrane component n=2 Tax=Pyrobaculum arsenaticum TaxID=121277 RepID=A4WKY5_PYRAR|nr:ABC transporter permease [Pyrobaculum arsenaticum]ABP51052.1 binding-protein-dependent transport systems inner membrane component [Pyrobaculum arsenaticum DSM 13514]MCY0891712.1 ABC transporter permease [Pyrobaculum arsenaticum]NYR15222.1 ABC transporter permease [Pyrobaculum arsenaticum]
MASLLRYAAYRVLLAIPTLIILLTVVFFILRVIPGNPIVAMVGMKAPPEYVEQLIKEAGLDKPLPVQYVEYMVQVFTGNLGRSLIFGRREVAAEIMDRLPATVELAVSAFVVSVLLGHVFGFLAARYGGRVDAGARLYAMVSYVLFIPFIGLALQLVFAVWLGWFPVAGRITPGLEPPRITGLYLLDSLLAGRLDSFIDALSHIVLPSVTLGLVLSGVFVRLIRNNMVKTLGEDFISAYRAMGFSERAVLWKAYRVAIVPTVTMMGLQLALLLQGAVLTETTFSWPGLGTLLLERIQYLDYTTVQGAVVVFVIIVVVLNVAADLINAVLDPRVRRGL